MILQDDEQFYKLLCLSLGLSQEFPVVTDDDEWRRLYQTTVRQSLVGVCYKGICLLPKDKMPPLEIAMQWASEAETIRGLNELQYQEAARLTKLFTDQGRRTAILKGQANARLYPNPFSREPGDIDIWVEGGRESVIALALRIGLLDEEPSVANAGRRDKATASYHHLHLPKNELGIDVEIHYRPSSGNFNPFTNRRLQRWLEEEIQQLTTAQEGFCVPSVRFTLVMQLAHIQRHFLSGGIGLRQICDYYWLLRNATDEDRQAVGKLLKRFGLHQTAGALMWVLGEVLQSDSELMVCKPDVYRGEWMLSEIMDGGNFGFYAPRAQHGIWRRFFMVRRRQLKLMRFDFWEIFWMEVNFWKVFIRTVPERIRRRKLSLGNYKKHGDEIF